MCIRDRYGDHPGAVEENLQKLFVAHLRLPRLGPSEQEEVLMNIIGPIVHTALPVVNAVGQPSSSPPPSPPAVPASTPASSHPQRSAAELTDDDRRALRNGLTLLSEAHSEWAAPGPRAIESYVLLYKLA